MSKFIDWLKRRLLLGHGDVLAPAEQWLLRQLLNSLPPHLKSVAQEQIAHLPRAYREVDGRAINFYPRPGVELNFPTFDMNSDEAPLVRITVSAAGVDTPIHAGLIAVHGRVFCISLSQPARHLPHDSMQLLKVKDAWRSNFPASASNHSSKPNGLRPSA